MVHTAPCILLLISVTAHSHSHSILSIVPAQTLVQQCWESDRGIDPAKNNNFYFSLSQFSGRAAPDVAGWWWKAGGCRSRGGTRRAGRLPDTSASGYAGLRWSEHKAQVFKADAVVRILPWFPSLTSRGSFVPCSSQMQLLTTLREHRQISKLAEVLRPDADISNTFIGQSYIQHPVLSREQRASASSCHVR